MPMTAVLAHRGATAGAPENTVMAFRAAARLGADGVELDVRRSADGALVVHHDAQIDGIGPVAGTLARDLPPHVPLLEEALGACEGMVVNVEIKSDGRPAVALATAILLVELGWQDRAVVSSFDAACLEPARDAGLAVGWLVGWAQDPRAHLGAAAGRGFGAVHPFVAGVDEPLVSEAHRAGLAVRVWTVNAPADIRRMVDLGVEAVITDQPREALAICRNGGVPPR